MKHWFFIVAIIGICMVGGCSTSNQESDAKKSNISTEGGAVKTYPNVFYHTDLGLADEPIEKRMDQELKKIIPPPSVVNSAKPEQVKPEQAEMSEVAGVEILSLTVLFDQNPQNKEFVVLHAECENHTDDEILGFRGIIRVTGLPNGAQVTLPIESTQKIESKSQREGVWKIKADTDALNFILDSNPSKLNYAFTPQIIIFSDSKIWTP